MSKLEETWLPPELCIEPDGHVTDTALACIADGELAIVPAAAVAHVEACEACGRRLGVAAVLSVAASEALTRMEAPLASLRPVPGLVRAPAPLDAADAVAIVRTARATPVAPLLRARRPLPVAAILVASILVLVTAGPTIADAIRAAPSLITGAVTTLPFVVRIGSSLVHGSPWGDGATALAVKTISAVFFVLAGLEVARRSERARALRGDVG
jgi:hypothetical protein